MPGIEIIILQERLPLSCIELIHIPQSFSTALL